VQEIIGHVVESSIEILSRKVPTSGTLDLSTDDVNDSFLCDTSLESIAILHVSND